MTSILFIIYIGILIFLIMTFLKCLKKKVKWSRLILFELIFIMASAILLTYYDHLPGSGLMPGLTYLDEVFLSFCAMASYVIMLALTLITKLIRCLLEKSKRG